MYPAVPYNASSIYEIIKMKWNKIKSNILYGALHYCARRVPLGVCALMCAKCAECDSVTGAPDFGEISAKSAQNTSINRVPIPTKAHN